MDLFNDLPRSFEVSIEKWSSQSAISKFQHDSLFIEGGELPYPTPLVSMPTSVEPVGDIEHRVAPAPILPEFQTSLSGMKIGSNDPWLMEVSIDKWSSQSAISKFQHDSLFIEGGSLPHPTPLVSMPTSIESVGDIEHRVATAPIRPEFQTSLSGMKIGSYDSCLMEGKSLPQHEQPANHATPPVPSGSNASSVDVDGMKDLKKKGSFVCGQCGRRSPRKWNIEEHQLTHQSLEELRKKGLTYSCERCGKHFKRKSDRNEHTRKLVCLKTKTNQIGTA